ncbi:biotin transporter BioY [Streptococcus equi subsp. zooepidemicus]|uniref:biotin transporter BioY n=1 Tax=Streptococcus equi TaxID=1336 RepID=UPI000217497A|nr:biotin transporter BioY [Streptococcus equi]AEJ24416.1 BioY family protein [Streptococcus equi subsp. zooepidemicus ATCC 35246]AIA68189.1 biotin biosynthesis protein BioC [Streptococcus equi subsp. zooepidemicus CY]MBR7684677.1 biotin transporter BioY [Streptococcus equi subsp. zooepidemicus]MBR7753878.1 biotin transporter BioY [Streptococcus equi subsp. zooepidemicus]MBR7776848.1 biotin transporter BioY [Streptococcus equi subsp. zooepidemicus]
MLSTKDLVKVAMMTTLIIILGLIPAIPLGFVPVPIVLQNLGVMLAGLILGGKKGTLSILLFLVIGLFLPVFSGSRTTVPVLMGPSAGYVLAWLFVPLVFALLYRSWLARYRSLAFLAIFISGVLLVDLLGTIWLAVYTDMPLTRSLVASLVFIPGDTIKAVIATALAVSYKDSFLNTNS